MPERREARELINKDTRIYVIRDPEDPIHKLVLPATIHDRPVKMLLDTGSRHNVMSEQLTKQLGLKMQCMITHIN